jgi:hypothetical protein
VLEKQPDEVVLSVDRRHAIKNIAESVGQLRIDEVPTFDPQIGKAQLGLEPGWQHGFQLVSGNAGILEGNTKQLVVRTGPRRHRVELGQGKPRINTFFSTESFSSVGAPSSCAPAPAGGAQSSKTASRELASKIRSLQASSCSGVAPRIRSWTSSGRGPNLWARSLEQISACPSA